MEAIPSEFHYMHSAICDSRRGTCIQYFLAILKHLVYKHNTFIIFRGGITVQHDYAGSTEEIFIHDFL